jgi:hypothetical protein
MGTVVEKGEWAIVGGTGELTLARGVIYKHDSEFVRDEGDCIELDIHCLYTPMERSKVTQTFRYGLTVETQLIISWAPTIRLTFHAYVTL